MIDEQKLLAFLVEKAAMRSVVGGSIYQGLYDRIRDGQFEEKAGDDDGLGSTR